jgi:hypothetical protein
MNLSGSIQPKLPAKNYTTVSSNMITFTTEHIVIGAVVGVLIIFGIYGFIQAARAHQRGMASIGRRKAD